MWTVLKCAKYRQCSTRSTTIIRKYSSGYHCSLQDSYTKTCSLPKSQTQRPTGRQRGQGDRRRANATWSLSIWGSPRSGPRRRSPWPRPPPTAPLGQSCSESPWAESRCKNGPWCISREDAVVSSTFVCIIICVFACIRNAYRQICIVSRRYKCQRYTFLKYCGPSAF